MQRALTRREAILETLALMSSLPSLSSSFPLIVSYELSSKGTLLARGVFPKLSVSERCPSRAPFAERVGTAAPAQRPAQPPAQEGLTAPAHAARPTCSKCSCTDFSFFPALPMEILTNTHTTAAACSQIRRLRPRDTAAVPWQPQPQPRARRCRWRYAWSPRCVWVRKKTVLQLRVVFRGSKEAWLGSAFRNHSLLVPRALLGRGWDQKRQGLVKKAVLLQQNEK